MEDKFLEFTYSTPCAKHPNSSTVGICAYCLKDRLVKLVCSECGEQRLSSCSCSDVSSSYRNSCSTAMDVGSVGRVSFLIENDKSNKKVRDDHDHHQESQKPDHQQVIFLRRSSSSCVEVKKSNGFWKIKRLFRKKIRRSTNKGGFGGNGGGEFSDEKNEVWVPDIMGVSRSRSLCSFRGNHNDAFDEGSSEYGFSSAKISDVTSGIFTDSEPRKSGCFGQNERFLMNRGVYKESEFSANVDESSFIDLKLDVSSSSSDFCGGRISTGAAVAGTDLGIGFKNDHHHFGGNGGGGSRRITVNDKGLKRGTGKSHKVWKWIFKHHHSGKKDCDEN